MRAGLRRRLSPRAGSAWHSGRQPLEPRRYVGAAPWVDIARSLHVREEVHHRLELLRWKVLERRHRSRGVDQSAGNLAPRKARADVSQVGPGPAVAIIADRVASLASGLAYDDPSFIPLSHGRS